ncbi:MAG: hypothetical protein C4560_00345 [Nitrospiraceae bacterium]|nr:MAG: hypothetical protein C4560_00345 [Nitrospiraceae bacterium]
MNESVAVMASLSDETTAKKSEIEHILGLPFSENNRVQLLKSGREAFQSILDAVSSAEKIVCIEFYIFKDDDTGQKLSGLLKEKARQGIDIYLLYDHFGSFLTSRRFWSDLKKEGIKVRVSHPFKWSSPRSYLYRNHKKLLVIDGKKAFMGGFNIADEYHGYFKRRREIWRDVVIYLEGPIASILQGIFNKSWRTWKGDLITMHAHHHQATEGLPVIPIFVNSRKARRKMRKLLLDSIKNARERILLTTAYFIPSRRILRALLSAARRGVDLKLLLPGKSDVLAAHYAGRNFYTRLLRSGAEIYNYQGAILHAKTAVFDGCWSIIGSTNLDLQSLRRNEESNVGILDVAFGKKMTEAFHGDLDNSVKIERNLWSARPLYEKILERLSSLFMKYL